MEIHYNNEDTQKKCNNYAYASKFFEHKVFKKINSIINLIGNSESLLDIKNYPSLRFHDMEGNKYKDMWTLSVGNTGYRILIQALDANNNVIKKGDVWAEFKTIKIVKVMEVNNHYGE